MPYVVGATIDTRWIAPPLPLQIPVPFPSAVLRLFNQIIVERATAVDGVYAEVTAAGTRIPIDALTTLYTFADDTAGGLRTAWYRVRFRNSTTAALSSPTDPVQGGDDPALDVLTVQELRDVFLFGINLTLPDGTVVSDAVLEFYLKAAVTYVERILGIYVRPTDVVEKLDFIAADFRQHGFLQLNFRPVLSITEAKMTIPATGGDQDLVVFDPSWLRIDDLESGLLQIVPTGTLTGPAALSLAWGGSLGVFRDGLPQVFRITYQAGFARGKVPFDIRQLVGLVASIGPLHLAGNTIAGLGIAGQTTSLDSLMHQVKTTADPANEAFGAQIANLKKEIARMAQDIRYAYTGPQLGVLG